jgi:hypothetical protein
LYSQPYGIGVSYQADFLACEHLLGEGRVSEALALYQGPLLPRSDLPGIIEEREVLEEALLASENSEALLVLAERLGEDLELWEAALAALPKEDARAPIVRARVERVRQAWS